MSIGSYDTIVGEDNSGYVYENPLMFNSTVLPIPGKDREWVECLFAPAYQELLDAACKRYYEVSKDWTCDKENIALAQKRRLAFMAVLTNLSVAAADLADSMAESYLEHGV